MSVAAPTMTVSQHDMSIYSPALRALYMSGPRVAMTPHQFVAAYKHRNPDKLHLIYQPFAVPVYTRQHGRRARQLVVNPNSRSVVSRFLWDVRQAFAYAWDETKNRISILVNGHPLDHAHFVPALRAAAPYTVTVVPDVNGQFVLPTDEPIDTAELETRRQRELVRRRRAQQSTGADLSTGNTDEGAVAATAPPESPELGTPVMRVRDSIGDEFAQRMSDLSERVNRAQSGSAQFRIVASPQAARANALQAIRDAPIYAQLGYKSADDFFREHLKADDTTGLVNAVSHEMASQMRKMPSRTARFDPQGLRQLYKSKAISGPLMSQWADTVKGWFGQAPASRRANTDVYRVRNDYSLAVADGQSYTVTAPFPWQKQAYHAKRAATPAHAGESPFQPFAFEARTERAENRLRRYANDAALVRKAVVEGAAPSKSSSSTPVSRMPELYMPGDSLVYEDIDAAVDASSMPVGEPISASVSSMPPAEPISASVSSMPPAEPILASVSSMPVAEPIAVEQASSSPSAAPATAPIAAPVDAAKPETAPIADPVFASMPHVANHPIRSVSDDPLARELAREVIESEEYSGVVVPDTTAMPDDVRRKVAAALRAAPSAERSAQVKPYLLKRMFTSGSVNALLSDKAEDKTPLMAGNMRSWIMSSDGRGAFKLHAPNGDTAAASVVRIKERPEAVILYSPWSHKHAQH